MRKVKLVANSEVIPLELFQVSIHNDCVQIWKTWTTFWIYRFSFHAKVLIELIFLLNIGVSMEISELIW